ncbi:MAG: hypothetical protein ACLFM1_05485 [Bacteroidales bacterium]
MKTHCPIIIFFTAIMFIFTSCSDDPGSLNNYIIAGETTPEQTAHYTFDVSMPVNNQDTSINLDINDDGIQDIKLMNLSFEETDSTFIRRTCIQALGNLQLAQEINPTDSLHFVDSIYECNYAQGEIINQDAPWQLAGHEIMFQHNAVITSYSDSIISTTTVSRRVSLFDPSKPYIGFRLYTDNQYHYGWIKFNHSQNQNYTTISIEEAAITQVYTD